MGISISAYRATIGLFTNRRKQGRIVKCPKSFFTNSRHNFSFGVMEWSLYLCKEKLYKKNIDSMIILRNVIAGSLILQMLIILSCDVHKNPGPARQFSICHANIRSIRSRDHLLHVRCDLAGNFDIITLSETWLTTRDDSNNFALIGYQKPFRRDRSTDDGYGGVMAWVADHVPVKRRRDLEIVDIEIIWLEICQNNVTLLLGVVYRAPNTGQDFWESLLDNIKFINETNLSRIILTGDFNADPSTRHGQLFQAFIEENSFTAFVNEPTRVTDVSATLLDQCITNFPPLIQKCEVIAPVGNSDHCTIAIYCRNEVIKEKPYKRTMWQFNDESFEHFRNAVQAFRWEDQFANSKDDLDICCQEWNDTVLEIAKSIIPHKNVLVRPNDKPWYNNQLRKLKRKMDRSFAKCKLTKLPSDYAMFKRLRSEYQNEIERCKKLYDESRYADLSSKALRNTKKWWSLLKAVYHNAQVYVSIPPLHYGNRIVTDTKEKAELFNNAFISVSKVDDSQATLPDFGNFAPHAPVLEKIVITDSEVEDQIRLLDCNKAYGPDDISPHFLKHGGVALRQSLTRIFNQSLAIGKFPSMWKKSHVIPVHKKGDQSDVNNYRPISLISVVAKVFERIVFKHVFNFFHDNFVLSVHQSGFQPGRSTVTQLIEVYHTFCQAVDANKEIRVVFLDITKAFDKIWHKGLIYKLRKCGIGGCLLQWFCDYLHERMQRVVISGQYSSWEHVTAGVPQGSVLGPLLFLVFINDVTSVVENSKIRLFADDTCLFIEVDDRNEAALKISHDLSNIHDWSTKWLVDFSPSKTKSLIVSNKKDANLNPPVLFNNVIIDEVSSYKYLGLHFASNLRWNSHIDAVTKNAHMRLNRMLPLKWKLDRGTLETMYNVLVLSCMQYASVVWGGTYDSDILKLERLHIEGLRLITGATARSNIANIYGETRCKDIRNMCNDAMLSLMYKIKHNDCPPYLANLLPPETQEVSHHDLRNKHNITVPYNRLECLKRSFFPRAIALWNKLPMSSRNLPSYESFKRHLKPPKTDLNTLYYYGQRWPAVHHTRMRLGCSKLNYDLCFNLRVIDRSTCRCGAHLENAHHYLTMCPLYQDHRTIMQRSVQQVTNFNVKVLLYGDSNLSLDDNILVFQSVHKFIIDSNRFN